jgi:hypothetical protein
VKSSRRLRGTGQQEARYRARSAGRALRFGLGVALASTVLAAAPRAMADDTPSLEALNRADELFQKGNRAFEEGDIDAAYRFYVEAWSLKKGIDIAANLGVVELKLGKHRDAADHIAYSLRLFPAQGRAEARERLMQKLGEAKASVATVRVDVGVDGAVVTVDGVELGRAPLRDELYVEPGLRSFRAAREGYEAAEARIELAAGTSSKIALSLQPLPATGLSAAPAPAESQSSTPKPLWPALTLGGVTAVGAGLGITFTLMGIGEESDLESVTCPGGPETCPESALDGVDRRNGFMTVGAAGFVVGGAALVGLITYLAWPSGGEPGANAARLELVPIAGPNHQGLVLSGEF